jgi:hypothetical protein
MILRSLDIRSFRCISRLRVEFGDRLNVLHGPNELGKSTLLEAIRAALLLPATATVAEEFVPWGTDETPQVIVEFEVPGTASAQNASASSDEKTPNTRWRVTKTFGRRSKSLLERFTGQGRIVEEAKGRDVDGRLRSLLDWGIQSPGGRGGQKGWPSSYLITALLGSQEGVADIIDASLDSDKTESGRNRLTNALGALAQAPEVTALLDGLGDKLNKVFTPTGRKSTSDDSPLTRITEQKRCQTDALAKLQRRVEESDRIETDIHNLRKDLKSIEERHARRAREVELLVATNGIIHVLNSGKELQKKLIQARAEFDQADAAFKAEDTKRHQQEKQLKQAETTHQQAKEQLASLDSRQKQLTESADTSRESLRRQLGADRSAVVQRADQAQRVIDAERELANSRKSVESADSKLVDARQAHQHAVRVMHLALHRSVEEAGFELDRRKAVTQLVLLRRERERIVANQTSVSERCRQFEELAEECKTADEVLAHLKLNRASLESSRQERLEAASLARTAKQDAVSARNLLENEQRKAEAAESKSRAYLQSIIRLDEAEEHRTVTQQKREHLTQEREAAEIQLADQKTEYEDTTRSDSFWKMIAIAAGAGAFLTLVLAIVMSNGKIILGIGSGLAGATSIVAALRWRQYSAQKAELTKRSDELRQLRDSLLSRELIIDSELASAQRDAAAARQSIPEQVTERFDSLQDARSALEQLRTKARENQDRLEQEIASLQEELSLGDQLSHTEDPVAQLAEQLGEVDRQISDRESCAQTLRSRRDAAEALWKDALSAVATNESAAAPEAVLTSLDERIESLATQADWPSATSLPEISEAEANEQAARDALVTSQSRLKSATGKLPTSGNDDDDGKTPTVISVEQSEQELNETASRLEDSQTKFRDEQAILKTRQETFDRLKPGMQEPAEDVLKAARREEHDLAEQLENLEAQVHGNLADADQECRDAQSAKEESGKAVETEAERLKELKQVAFQKQQLRDAARAEVVKAETGSESVDVDAAKAQLREIKATIASDMPDVELSTEQYQDSIAALQGLKRERKQATQSLDATRGQLVMAGGEVAREELQAAEDELDRIETEAADLELEYDAMKFLHDTLLQTSERHTAHLGKSLSQPVAERFRKLTEGRYDDLKLEPDLKVSSVEVARSDRGYASVSVGTRHQLATLIRLAVASHLRTAVVLDDQLVHSDAHRLLWFREQLRRVVSESQFQVLVVTCRPLDYVTEDELQGSSDVSIIDLASRTQLLPV